MNPPFESFRNVSIDPFEPGASQDPLIGLAPVTVPVTIPVSEHPPGILPFSPHGDFIRYYGMRENPFADSVNPGFFFRTESHSQAFRDMMLAIDFQASLGMVTGPSGTGKTLVTQLLLQQLDDPRHCVILVLVTPGMSKTGLLREILSELDLPLPVGISRVQDLVKLLSNHIIDLHQQGRRLVVMIDECHLLSADCLHVLRTISNIEIPQQKLTTCLLFGESRLLERLKHASYESLRNRIYMRVELQPLSAEETADYVSFRLMTAGRLAEVFDAPALAAIHRFSGGICRSVNKLTMLALIEGASRDRATIDEEIVKCAAARM